MKNKQLNKVRFDFIRYANCWEDADVLLTGLNAQPGGRHLSIGSAGDNSFSLLTTDPEYVVAVDISKVQLFLIELKKLAIKHFSHQEFLEFSGFIPSKRRLLLFNKIKNELDTEAKSYWEHHSEVIENGIIYNGKFERYLLFFSKRILPLIHSKNRIEELFAPKSEEEQIRFYSEKWNSFRWRIVFRLFFNKWVLGKFGRDPEFLNEVNVPVAQYLFQKAEDHFKSTRAQNNYFLHFIQTGNFGNCLPHYAREAQFKIIKKNINRLFTVHGFAEKALQKYQDINYMNLSNIFEYMDVPMFKNVVKVLLDKSAPNAKFAYWNLMVPRKFTDYFQGQVKICEENSKDLSQRDNGFFYNQFIINQKL